MLQELSLNGAKIGAMFNSPSFPLIVHVKNPNKGGPPQHLSTKAPDVRCVRFSPSIDNWSHQLTVALSAA